MPADALQKVTTRQSQILLGKQISNPLRLGGHQSRGLEATQVFAEKAPATHDMSVQVLGRHPMRCPLQVRISATPSRRRRLPFHNAVADSQDLLVDDEWQQRCSPSTELAPAAYLGSVQLR